MFALHRGGIRPRGSWRADRRPLGAQTAMSQTVETFCLVFCGAQITGIRRLANRFVGQDGRLCRARPARRYALLLAKFGHIE
jgi:hypothetical protein